MWTIFEGLLEPRGVEVVETPEAMAQRLATEEARARDEAVRQRLGREHAERLKRLVKPVLGQEELHFEAEDEGGYREPPKSEVELLRGEIDALRKTMGDWIRVRKGQIIIDLVCSAVNLGVLALLIWHAFL